MRSVITRARRVMGVFGAAALAAGGGVALNASAASAATTTVHTKAQLQAAWQNPATSDITLAADIATCGTMSRSSTTAVTVHGNGHALRSTCAGTMLRQTGVGAVGVFRLTLRDAMPNNDNLDGGNALDAPLAAVRVDHDLVENNSAYKGGAVHAKSLVIVSSRFVHNGNAIADEQIGSAGAVVAEGDVAVQNSTFADNVAYGEAGIVAKGTVTVTGSTFIDNGGRDGAMAVAAANATITSSTFTNNISYDAFPAPGGAVGVSGTLRVSHSTFTGNQGGIGDGGALGGPTIAVVDSVFSGNGTAEGRGGAIEGNDVAVTRSTFHHNGADGAGGAIHAEHSLLAVASTFDGNLTEVGGTPNPTGGAISGAR
ncbi:MAG TPA: pectate lyase-like adhesive domain-containing protein [Acidimicrobiia bacterium]